MTTFELSGDVASPSEAKQFMAGVAASFRALATSYEQSRSNLAGEGVKGAPIDLLDSMREHTTLLATKAEDRAGRFADHEGEFDDALDETTQDTQAGKYGDRPRQ